jgi:hypothetical protein
MTFFARRGNVNDKHPYATTPNVNTQRHLHQSGFYISYTSLISILLQHHPGDDWYNRCCFC